MTIFRCRIAAHFLALMVMSAPGYSQPQPKQSFSAEQMLQLCSADGETDQDAAFQLICSGYISGVMDSLTTNAGIDGMEPFFCLPENAVRSEPMNAFVAHMKQHPEKGPAVAASVVRTALKERFPCESKRQ